MSLEGGLYQCCIRFLLQLQQMTAEYNLDAEDASAKCVLAVCSFCDARLERENGTGRWRVVKRTARAGEV